MKQKGKSLGKDVLPASDWETFFISLGFWLPVKTNRLSRLSSSITTCKSDRSSGTRWTSSKIAPSGNCFKKFTGSDNA